MLVCWYISIFLYSYIFTFLYSELLITCCLYNLAYPSFYGFTGSISPASRVLILNQYKSPLNTCTILFIRSVTCPIAVIIWLFNRDPRPLSDPLFSVNDKVFLVPVVCKILLMYLVTGGILPDSYFNYSFYRGAAQHIYNYGFVKSQTAQLG